MIARELLENNHNKDGYSLGIEPLMDDTVIDSMIEFAKFHVEKALSRAAENAEVEYLIGKIDGPMEIVNKNSILNSYNLENIK